jgi:hypothetical protein
MWNSATRIILGIVVLVGLILSLVMTGDDRYDNTDSSLAQACADVTTFRHLESALFDARAQSTGGEDRICTNVPVPVTVAGRPSDRDASGAHRDNL